MWSLPAQQVKPAARRAHISAAEAKTVLGDVTPGHCVGLANPGVEFRCFLNSSVQAILWPEALGDAASCGGSDAAVALASIRRTMRENTRVDTVKTDALQAVLHRDSDGGFEEGVMADVGEALDRLLHLCSTPRNAPPATASAVSAAAPHAAAVDEPGDAVQESNVPQEPEDVHASVVELAAKELLSRAGSEDSTETQIACQDVGSPPKSTATDPVQPTVVPQDQPSELPKIASTEFVSTWQCRNEACGKAEPVVHRFESFIVQVPVYPTLERMRARPQAGGIGDAIDIEDDRPQKPGPFGPEVGATAVPHHSARTCDTCNTKSDVVTCATRIATTFAFVDLAWHLPEPPVQDVVTLLTDVIEDEFDFTALVGRDPLPASDGVATRLTARVETVVIFRGSHYATIAVQRDALGNPSSWWVLNDGSVSFIGRSWNQVCSFIRLRDWVPRVLGVSLLSTLPKPGPRWEIAAQPFQPVPLPMMVQALKPSQDNRVDDVLEVATQASREDAALALRFRNNDVSAAVELLFDEEKLQQLKARDFHLSTSAAGPARAQPRPDVESSSGRIMAQTILNPSRPTALDLRPAATRLPSSFVGNVAIPPVQPATRMGTAQWRTTRQPRDSKEEEEEPFWHRRLAGVTFKTWIDDAALEKRVRCTLHEFGARPEPKKRSSMTASHPCLYFADVQTAAALFGGKRKPDGSVPGGATDYDIKQCKTHPHRLIDVAYVEELDKWRNALHPGNAMPSYLAFEMNKLRKDAPLALRLMKPRALGVGLGAVGRLSAEEPVDDVCTSMPSADSPQPLPVGPSVSPQGKPSASGDKCGTVLEDDDDEGWELEVEPPATA